MKSIKTTSKTDHYYFRALVALAALALAASLLVVSTARPAHAETTFTVNLTDNRADANPGDGQCSVATFGAFCTLRAAIQEANATTGADTINFKVGAAADGLATISPTSALPAITEQVTIDGYTQPGSSPNTLAKGTNAVLKIELDGSKDGSGAAGLLIETSDVVVKGLVINRFKSAGILIGGSRNSIEGNFIGTDPSGTRALGNGFSGVDVEGFLGNQALNNFIGGSSPDKRNLISGNVGTGVSFLGELAGGSDVLGNLIGTQKDGTSPLGNGGGGVGLFGSAFNAVGDISSGSANTIAFNRLGGVLVGNGGPGTTDNRILRNSIFSNAGLGIDLGNDGPTPNDASDPDEGPNALQNKPVVRSAKTVSGTTTIKGKLNSTPNLHFLVQFYSNPKGNEGKKFIGQKEVLTDGSGNVTFTFKPKKKVGVGQKITATATSFELPFGRLDTSEFSASKKVAAS